MDPPVRRQRLLLGPGPRSGLPASGGAPMSVVLPLAVWPHPVPPVVMDALRVAKETLCARDGLDFKVQVSPAVPGSPTRVLSFNGPPPFAADTAMLRNWQDPDELAY